jgi:hypothetical protein
MSILFSDKEKLPVPQIEIAPYAKGLLVVTKTFNFYYKGKRYSINKGFIFDSASVPWLAKMTIGSGFRPEYITEAAKHDRNYRIQDISRKEADLLFLEGLKLNGVSWYTRYKMYYGVRVGGWAAWNGHKKSLVKK